MGEIHAFMEKPTRAEASASISTVDQYYLPSSSGSARAASNAAAAVAGDDHASNSMQTHRGKPRRTCRPLRTRTLATWNVEGPRGDSSIRLVELRDTMIRT
eukprot:5487273-Pyramimonas_sp.AAC.1